jgi:hypothetical protein
MHLDQPEESPVAQERHRCLLDRGHDDGDRAGGIRLSLGAGVEAANSPDRVSELAGEVVQELLLGGGNWNAADDNVHHLSDCEYGGPQAPKGECLLDGGEDGGRLAVRTRKPSGVTSADRRDASFGRASRRARTKAAKRPRNCPSGSRTSTRTGEEVEGGVLASVRLGTRNDFGAAGAREEGTAVLGGSRFEESRHVHISPSSPDEEEDEVLLPGRA